MRHELNPEYVFIEVEELTANEEGLMEKIDLINVVFTLANTALKEYGVQIVPSINFKEEE